MERPLHRVALRALLLGAAGMVAAVLLVLGAGSASADENPVPQLPAAASEVARDRAPQSFEPPAEQAAEQAAERVVTRAEPVVKPVVEQAEAVVGPVIEPVREVTRPLVRSATERLPVEVDDELPAGPAAPRTTPPAERPEEAADLREPPSVPLLVPDAAEVTGTEGVAPETAGAVPAGAEPADGPGHPAPGSTRTWAAPAPSSPRVGPSVAGTPLPPAYLTGDTPLRLSALGVVTCADHALPSSLPALPGTRPD